ncbi:MAG TPA: YicC family protein [Candidatus Bilophila faecipullorum]|uniref:YicC family protein n=1 Tax=Candidatus Bilophila faecipullorum TaxID=2838482 RepID=A0A9D1U7Z6_9BACT|nr:YicC/YloC family endoribonuclease [uncultured Bilophila sp.]HIW78074.1 YicC family protein [Candidatus Bilophila faecipullorum]
MLRSMTGFGRCVMEDDDWTQTWEIRSVNNRHLDLKWRLPVQARGLESRLERVVRRFAARGRLEVTLTLQMRGAAAGQIRFDAAQASAMLDQVGALADLHGDAFEPDYNALFAVPSLWERQDDEGDDELEERLEEGLVAALEDWNESRETEGAALARDMAARIGAMETWVSRIEERAPAIKEERFAVLRERLAEALGAVNGELEEGRFLQEMVILADKLDVSEELTRLHAHLERLRDLLAIGTDAGRRLDFTLQECFREIATCGNKIQDAQTSRIVVDFKNELEKCREQVQNLE